jgi:hypothetical protein
MAEISALNPPPVGQPVLAPDSGKPRGVPMEIDSLRVVARRFEAAFLAEMLRHSGLGKMPESINGGAGEAAFSGTLIQAYADRIAETGTLGIAERIYFTLSRRGTQ